MKTLFALIFAAGLYAQAPLPSFSGSGGGGGSATCGSTDTQLCYNNAGAFGGVTGSSWDLSNRTLRLLTVSAGEMFAFSTNPAGDALNCGSVFYINCSGNTVPSVSGATATNGGSVDLIAIDGGNTTVATTGTGGNGGRANLVSGGGGSAANANTSSTGGDSGAITLSVSTGGPAAGSGTNLGGNGGELRLTSGDGGSASGGMSNTGGDGGNAIVALGAGGAGSTANGLAGEFRINGASTVFKVTRVGVATSTLLATTTNCADSAGAAACGAAPAGAFVIDAASTSTVVSTTAVTATSRIFLQEDSSLGTELGVTCNTQSSLTLGALRVTAKTAATSFTATIEAGPTTNPMCVSYWIVN